MIGWKKFCQHGFIGSWNTYYYEIVTSCCSYLTGMFDIFLALNTGKMDIINFLMNL